MAQRRIAWWKLVGMAGVAGVAAGGVLIARNERQRKSYTPDEVRTRLQERLNEATEEPGENEKQAS
ncbi:hypothetical protein [Kineosporia babensis]|uniref:Uncharacterized protein n=1 Tax=Kineosporia babensis TaxID=499548 RepID=A0A9X1NF35_9ACTN|nr:hypothetical protein [Kineosporia babensis]MCD5312645.1 hypothetical protein [Kineosporia babensis]